MLSLISRAVGLLCGTSSTMSLSMLRISLQQASGINTFFTNEGFLTSYKKKEASLDWWIDWLVFNAIFSSISAISWRYKSKWIPTEPMGTKIESNFSAVVQNISLESSVNKACGQNKYTTRPCTWRNWVPCIWRMVDSLYCNRQLWSSSKWAIS